MYELKAAFESSAKCDGLILHIANKVIKYLPKAANELIQQNTSRRCCLDHSCNWDIVRFNS
jgi:hypothetical protein